MLAASPDQLLQSRPLHLLELLSLLTVEGRHRELAEGEVRAEGRDDDQPVLPGHAGLQVDQLEGGLILPLPQLDVAGVGQLLPVLRPDHLRLGISYEVNLQLGGLRLSNL